jgi:hydroxyacylglutathione hydrolase
MLVERVWAANALRNYHYLVACPESGECLAIDPLEWQRCLDLATARGWTITQILNTHEHADHTAGNAPLVAATGAKVLAHAGAAAVIGGVDIGLAKGDVVKVGRTVELEVLDTPGHTMCHVCLVAHGDEPALFCGDTLFNAGAGNCVNGGDMDRLYETFVEQLARLPAATRVMPGHDYIERNLAFTMDREPGNADAGSLLQQVSGQDPSAARVTTLGVEKQVNTFFRLQSPAVISRLREAFPELGEAPTPREVFIALRTLRNRW